MSKKPRAQLTSLLIGLIALLVTGQGASGFVLCIGEGDHYAIEPAFADKCISAAPCPQEGLSCNADHCGPCQDIDASFASLHVNGRADHLTPPPLARLAPVYPRAMAPESASSLTGTLFSRPPPRTPASLATLRTIVLLI